MRELITEAKIAKDKDHQAMWAVSHLKRWTLACPVYMQTSEKQDASVERHVGMS